LRNSGAVRGADDDFGVGPNFISCDREQPLLLPPSLREWLPEGHVAWFVIDAVERLDLSSFYADYRLMGRVGRRTSRR
jgi:hypothetical protein